MLTRSRTYIFNLPITLDGRSTRCRCRPRCANSGMTRKCHGNVQLILVGRKRGRYNVASHPSAVFSLNVVIALGSAVARGPCAPPVPVPFFSFPLFPAHLPSVSVHPSVNRFRCRLAAAPVGRAEDDRRTSAPNADAIYLYRED